MNSLIVVYSYHHNNTLKIAEAIGSVLGSAIKSPKETEESVLSEFDLIGFGSGIDSDKHYQELLDFSSNLPEVNSKKCFVFSTSTLQGNDKVEKDHSLLKKILISKGYNIIGEFSCKGHNSNSFLKVFGGLNKKRPNKFDIQNAKDFAVKIKGL